MAFPFMYAWLFIWIEYSHMFSDMFGNSLALKFIPDSFYCFVTMTWLYINQQLSYLIYVLIAIHGYINTYVCRNILKSMCASLLFSEIQLLNGKDYGVQMLCFCSNLTAGNISNDYHFK